MSRTLCLALLSTLAIAIQKQKKSCPTFQWGVGGRGREREKGGREGGAATIDNEKKRIRKNEAENAGWVYFK